MPEKQRAAKIVIVLLSAVAAFSVVGCSSMQDFSDRLADDARFWGDHVTAAVLGDDPARD